MIQIQEYINYFNNLMKENQALTVVFGGGILYQIINYLRIFYNYIKRIFLYYFCHTYIINQAEDYALYNNTLILLKKIIKSPRNEKIHLNESNVNSKISIGKHINFYKFHYIEIIISEIDKTGVERNVESCKINIYGLRPRKIGELLKQDIKTIIDENNKRNIMIWKTTGINNYGRYNKIKKSIDHLFINRKIKENLLQIINDFEFSEKFSKFGIQKKLGILLHGPPGTGKSTFPLILGEMLRRDIYNLSATEAGLKSACNGHFAQEKTIIVIDDIDSLKISHKRENDPDNKKSDEINISTLLSFLDGRELPNDIIIIASTNNLEKLDSAIIRHGRFDYIIEFPQADYEVAREMVQTLCPDKMDILEQFTYPISQAEIQAKLLCN